MIPGGGGGGGSDPHFFRCRPGMEKERNSPTDTIPKSQRRLGDVKLHKTTLYHDIFGSNIVLVNLSIGLRFSLNVE